MLAAAQRGTRKNIIGKTHPEVSAKGLFYAAETKGNVFPFTDRFAHIACLRWSMRSNIGNDANGVEALLCEKRCTVWDAFLWGMGGYGRSGNVLRRVRAFD